MKLKTVDVGGVTYAVINEGKPVYLKDDGTEAAIDAAGLIATIGARNGEAKANREAKEAAEARLKAFEGIDDPASALDALQKIKNIDASKLVDAGKIEEIRLAAIKSTEEKYKPVMEERDAYKSQLHKEVIGGNFARSKFIADKLAIPSDLVEARFGDHFSFADGKINAKDSSGNPIYSPSNPGNPASFDEALEFLVSAYPQRDSILKGSQNQGMGSTGSNMGAGGKTITRAQFDKLPALEKATVAKSGITFVD